MAHECKGVTRSVIKRHEPWQGRLGCPIEPVSDFHIPFTPVFPNDLYRQVLYIRKATVENKDGEPRRIIYLLEILIH